MKYLLFITTAVFFFQTQAQERMSDCSDVVRAPNTDQIKMLLDVSLAPQAFNLDPQNIYSSKIKTYVSWKDKQASSCLADVVHRAEIEVRTIQGNEICTKTSIIHRKDYFTTPFFNSEYKIRDTQETCSIASPQESETIESCKAADCGFIDDVKTFPDYQDGCKCKMYDETLIIQDQTGKYEGFFNPNVAFPKPEGIESPFSQ